HLASATKQEGRQDRSSLWRSYCRRLRSKRSSQQYAARSGALIDGYQRRLENQSDRLGLEYMVNAGYDPREAPRVWKAMTNKLGDSPTDFFWSNHDNNATRRSYLMNELKTNYSTLEYPRFRINEAQYRAIVERVHAASKSTRKIRVTQ